MTATLADLIGTVSPSRIACANRCLAQFLFRYVERAPFVRSAALSFGSAVDATSNDVFSAKLADPARTAPAKDVADQFAANWDYEANAVDEWGDDDRDDLMDCGTKGMSRWRDEIAAHLRPRLVQQKITKPITDPATGDTFDLLGVLDLVAVAPGGGEVVADTKTSGRRYGPDKFARELQPPAYSLLADVPTFEYHVITRTKRPDTQVLRATITDSDRYSFVRRTGMLRRQVATAYRTGDWLPNRSHTLCSRRYCEHWRRCEQQFGGEVAR